MEAVEREPDLVPQIGLATIYPASITQAYRRNPWPIEAPLRSEGQQPTADALPRGILTTALVDVLQRSAALALTYAEWVDCASGAQPHARLGHPDAGVFENAVMRDRALSLVRQMRDRDLDVTTDLLRRLTELRRGRDPASYLDLALACALSGRLDEARLAAETGLAYRQQAMAEAGTGTSAVPTEEGEIFWPEAHYLRGRILFGLGRYSAAESALGIALPTIDPGHRAMGCARRAEARCPTRSGALLAWPGGAGADQAESAKRGGDRLQAVSVAWRAAR